MVYVGQTISVGERGIIGRVRRHLTSARSDIIANRQIDVWELAFVRAWPTSGVSPSEVDLLETRAYNAYRASIVAGKDLPLLEPGTLPDYIEVRIIEAEERERRLSPSMRLPRQVRQVDQLLDAILHVKDSTDQRRSLSAHILRLRRRFAEFTRSTPPEDDEVAL